MSAQLHYETVSDARRHLKDVFDVSGRGRTVTVKRDDARFAIIPVDRLRNYFRTTVAANAVVSDEGDVWVVLMKDRPFVSEGLTIDEAVDDLIDSLREYADGFESLQAAPNHARNWALVQLVLLSSDEELRSWLLS